MLATAASAAAVLQALAMAWDEFGFHRARRLGTFESWGHVADGLAYLVPLMVAALAAPTAAGKAAYAASAALSCALVTKDEWVHAAECAPAEHWLHSVLFVLHPCVLIPVGLLWTRGEAASLRLLLPPVVALFSLQQAAYWLVLGHRRPDEPAKVNNEFYGALGDLWHEGDGHAIALLRAETRERLVYVRESFAREGVPAGARVLDIGCGGGLAANALGADGYRVTGVDAAEGALASARARVPAGARVEYATADAYALPVEDGAFDAVLLLDVLEHFERPARAVAEAARALRPGGLLVVHTFNRTWIGWLLAVKGIAFLVRDCPPNVHVYRLLVRPDELDAMTAAAGLARTDLSGIRPRVLHAPFWRSLLRRRVDPGFEFTRASSTAAGYLACFVKRASC